MYEAGAIDQPCEMKGFSLVVTAPNKSNANPVFALFGVNNAARDDLKTAFGAKARKFHLNLACQPVAMHIPIRAGMAKKASPLGQRHRSPQALSMRAQRIDCGTPIA